jgi:CRP/FNR family transcriptional regulator
MNNIANFSGCTIGAHNYRCFDKLTPDEKKLIDSNTVLVNYTKGEVICKRGSLASHVMYIEKGLVKVYLEDGVNILVLKILPEKNLLGLAALSDDSRTFEYSVMAYIDTEVRQIDTDTFRKILNQNPVFAKEVIDIQNDNSIQIYSRFFCLTHKQSFGRLADIILCLADRIFKSNEFELPLSRKELAELSGLSPETVIRMLKVFKEEGLIDIQSKRIMILNHKRIKEISETG